MKRCFIFAAGSFFGLREHPAAGDFVIAADAGYLLCRELQITPSVILGDFDSADAPADAENLIRVPVEKDDTDTMLAIRHGLQQGCTEFFIYGGTGGNRLDHTLANLQSLAYLRRRGARGYLYDRDFVYTVIENETLEIPRTKEWGILSLFSMGASAEDLTVDGVQYPLSDAAITCDFPLGVSNHILAETARITVGEGPLLVGYELG